MIFDLVLSKFVVVIVLLVQLQLSTFLKTPQIYDNAMIAAGLNDDPRPMIARLNDLLSKALEKH